MTATAAAKRPAREVAVPQQTRLRVEWIELARIKEDTGQPRRLFEARALGELAASLGCHGQKTPIVVRPQDEHFVIIEGHRRRRAAEMAGIERLWCVILPSMREREARLHQLHEIVHSKTLHRVELALALHGLQERLGFSNKQLAELLGKSPAFVSQMLSVATRVSPAILEEVQSSEIPGGIEALIQISRVPDQEKQKKLWALVKHKRLDLPQLRNEVKGLRKGSRRPHVAHQNDSDNASEHVRVQFDNRLERMENVRKLVVILRDHLNVELDEILSAVRHAFDVELGTGQ
jgi:ParB/RepB/Spo0J family partition protein